MKFLVFLIFLMGFQIQNVLAQETESPEIVLENFAKIFESPQSLLEQFSIDFGQDIETIDLLIFSLGMVAYGVFIWHFYRFIAKREIIALPLTKYQTDGKKITSLGVYVIKYLIVFPLAITAWFIVYSLFMFFLAPDIPGDFVFLIVISLVVAIRIAAYYKEDLAKDLAKMIPFSLLGVFLISTSLFTLDQLLLRLDSFIPFIGKITSFILFAVGVEAVLRIIFLVKRKFLPVAETKVEEDIEKTIDEKMKVKVAQIEEKHDELEDKLEEKIEKTEDKIEKKIEKTEDKIEDVAEKNSKNNLR